MTIQGRGGRNWPWEKLLVGTHDTGRGKLAGSRYLGCLDAERTQEKNANKDNSMVDVYAEA